MVFLKSIYNVYIHISPPIPLYHNRVAQVKQAHEQLEDELYEMSKPLARYADDEDLERMLKAREREGDPMLAYLQKKQTKIDAPQGRVKKREYNFVQVVTFTQLYMMHASIIIYHSSFLLPPPLILFYSFLISSHAHAYTHTNIQRDQRTRVHFLPIGLPSAQDTAGMVWTAQMVSKRLGLQIRQTRRPLQMKHISGV